jgi:hypothetical protein
MKKMLFYQQLLDAVVFLLLPGVDARIHRLLKKLVPLNNNGVKNSNLSLRQQQQLSRGYLGGQLVNRNVSSTSIKPAPLHNT